MPAACIETEAEEFAVRYCLERGPSKVYLTASFLLGRRGKARRKKWGRDLLAVVPADFGHFSTLPLSSWISLRLSRDSLRHDSAEVR